MRISATTNRRRRGLTMLELLVVVGIIIILLAILIPAVKFAVEGRQIREGSRTVAVTCGAAQGKSAESGRPVGLWLKRETRLDPNGRLVSWASQAYIAVVVPPYSGDVVGAQARINGWTATLDGFSASFAALVRSGDIKVGNQIRFNYQGPDYRITAISGNLIRFTSRPLGPASGPQQASPPPSGRSFPYQIIRQPKRASQRPADLPNDTVIDLSYSGLGRGGREFAPRNRFDRSPVLIMFSPNGNVDRVYYHNRVVRPRGTIHLLVGTTKQMGLQNLVDPGNLWVSIVPATGNVISAEMNPAVPPPGQMPGSSGHIARARRIARTSTTMTGK